MRERYLSGGVGSDNPCGQSGRIHRRDGEAQPIVKKLTIRNLGK
jgi:hypothetical protein